MNINSRKKLTSFNQLLAIVILAAFTLEGVSMSFFTKTEEEVVLFSEMEGHITFNGEPVKNTKIERLIKWKDDVGEKDYIETDEKGYFNFKEVKVMAKLSPLSQFTVLQELTAFFNDKEFVIWTMGKRTKHKYGELDGIPINLRCELTDEDNPMRLKSGLIVTTCKWDKIENINRK